MRKMALNHKEKNILTDVLLLRSILVISSIILILFLFSPIKVLLAKDFKTGEILFKQPIPDNNFTILYTHSVMLSEVTETYEVLDNRIILLESTYKDFGAGLPATTPYDFKIDENGLFKIYNINKEIKPLVYKTGSSRANHRIKINGSEYEFLNFSNQGTSVEFLVNKDYRFNLIKFKEG